MAFYAVWVQTGKEQAVTEELISRRIPGLESIFTLDRFTAILQGCPSEEVIEMNSCDYLQIGEMRKLMQRMRTAACEQDVDTRQLLQGYRKALHELTEAFRQQREASTSLLQGYVLIELAEEEQLSADTWHLIKDIPYVIDIPSDLAIPEAEIVTFFTYNPFVFIASFVKRIVGPFIQESISTRFMSQVESVRFVWSTALRQFIRKRLV